MFAVVVMIGLILVLPSVATIRLWMITKRLNRGALRYRKGVGQSLGILGCILLFVCLVLFWGTAVLSFFFMKPGASSGIPFFLAGIAFPFAWAISELLMYFGFISVPENVKPNL